MEEFKNILTYLDEYGDISLEESPFNDVDALVLAELAYFPFNKISGEKKIIKKADINKFIYDRNSSSLAKRKIKDNFLITKFIHSKRFSDVKIGYFVEDKSRESEKQFQAVAFIFKDMIFVGFAGTDASVVGWKEDLNLSFQNEIPSEISALAYLNTTLKRFRLKPVIVAGHSKGGLLSIYASKNTKNNKRISRIYSFDGPGFQDDFYDEKYEEISSKIIKIIPSESIIGRLFHKDINVMVIKANSRSILQHDTYNWIVEDNHFILEEGEMSEHVSQIINRCNNDFSIEEKKIVVDTIYDLFTELNITKFGNIDYNKVLMKNALRHLKDAYRTLSKERKAVLKDFIGLLIKTTFQEYLSKKEKIKLK